MTKWTVDASHTSVGFTVKHMMVSKVKGSFGAVEGTLEGNPEDLTGAKIDFKIDTSTSIQIAKTETITFVPGTSLIQKRIRASHSFQQIS